MPAPGGALCPVTQKNALAGRAFHRHSTIFDLFVSASRQRTEDKNNRSPSEKICQQYSVSHMARRTRRNRVAKYAFSSGAD
jgi:hypothetical protein